MKTLSSLKCIEPKDAIAIVVRELYNSGYYKASHSPHGSIYFSKRGSPFKIRVSDHPSRVKNYDVSAEIVIDYKTIIPDVHFRVQDALRKHQCHIRNTVNHPLRLTT